MGKILARDNLRELRAIAYEKGKEIWYTSIIKGGAKDEKSQELSLYEFVEEVEEPRRGNAIKHNLKDII